MPIYKYQGLSSIGKNIKSTIKAENINQAKQKIKSSGVMLTKIVESKDSNGGGGFNISIGQKNFNP